MIEVAAMEDVRTIQEPVVVSGTEAAKLASGGDGDVAMGDEDAHEKMVKAAKHSELFYFDSRN
jgi:hypothetical protein